LVGGRRNDQELKQKKKSTAAGRKEEIKGKRRIERGTKEKLGENWGEREKRESVLREDGLALT